MRSGSALVTYLHQTDASAAVCDVHARGPHVMRLDASMREAFVDGLVSGEVRPELWHDCAAAFLKSAAPEDAASLIDDIGKGYRSMILDSAFERSPAMQDRVVQMQRLYLDRENRIRDSHPTLTQLIADLRRALAKKALGPVATQLGQDLVTAIDVERGAWNGQTVDLALLDRFVAAGDEATLHLFTERLSDRSLRDESRRRVIRIHIARSPRPEVRADAEGVEARLMATGTNGIDVDRTPPTRGWLDAAKATISGVMVREDLPQQTASILGYRDPSTVSVLPDLQLRGVLFVETPGLSAPITLCGPPADLDPTPCIAPEDVKIDNPMAYLDNGGRFRFTDHISMSYAVSLMAMHDQFSLPMSSGGRPLLTMHWPFHYARPANLDFNTLGPRLTIKVDHRDPSRYAFSTTSPTGTYLAVVEAADLSQFHIISRGTTGSSGADGSSGSSGSSGAECGDGGAGSDGGHGGDGWPGGPGGDIDVEVDCGTASCGEALAVLRTSILSLGGPGGSGGRGGDGGSGGSGGAGRFPTTHTRHDGTIVTDDPGCSAGAAGRSGSRGWDGSTGPDGARGRVTISRREHLPLGSTHPVDP